MFLRIVLPFHRQHGLQCSVRCAAFDIPKSAITTYSEGSETETLLRIMTLHDALYCLVRLLLLRSLAGNFTQSTPQWELAGPWTHRDLFTCVRSASSRSLAEGRAETTVPSVGRQSRGSRSLALGDEVEIGSGDFDFLANGKDVLVRGPARSSSCFCFAT